MRLAAAALLTATAAAETALATSMAAEMVLLPRLHRFFRIELSRRSLRPLVFVVVVVDSSSESDIWRRKFNVEIEMHKTQSNRK